MENDRIDYLDYCKGIAIIIVSFGHILGSVVRNANTQKLLLICYAIELPLFFIVDGIQHHIRTKKEKRNIKQYVYKKAKRLLYPYMTFSFLYLVIDVFILSLKAIVRGTFSLGFLLMDLIDTITLWGVGSLWFLPTLFFADIIFVLLNENKKSWSLFLLSLIGVCGSSFFEPYYLSFLSHQANIIYFIGAYVCRIFVAISFISLGYYSWTVMNKIIIRIQHCGLKVILGLGLLIGGGGT